MESIWELLEICWSLLWASWSCIENGQLGSLLGALGGPSLLKWESWGGLGLQGTFGSVLGMIQFCSSRLPP